MTASLRSLSLKALLLLVALSTVRSFTNNVVVRGQRTAPAVRFGGVVQTVRFESTQPNADATEEPKAEEPVPVVPDAAAVVAPEAAVATDAVATPEAAVAATPVAATPDATPAAPDAASATPDATPAAVAKPTPKQNEYGEGDVGFPDTYVRCGKCQTIYAITEDDLGPKGRGRRLECSVCEHSWFQSKDRLMFLKDGFEYIKMPDTDLTRITQNIEEGRKPSFLGETKLYVGNIAFECSEQDIQDVFGEIGPVGDVSLVRDDLGRIRGFGFVTMRTKEDGQKAIDDLDGSEVRGRKIAVRESNN